MKNRAFLGLALGICTKLYYSTMETFPNCTNLHFKNRRKMKQNLLQGLFFCGILEQNRVKTRLGLHKSTIILQIYKNTTIKK